MAPFLGVPLMDRDDAAFERLFADVGEAPDASEFDRPDIRQAREEWRDERQPKMRLERTGWSSSTRPEPPRK